MDLGHTDARVSPRLARMLDELRPDEFGLRDRIASQLDASMLDEIAAADYGMDVDQHRWELSALLTTRRWPDELDWHPLEVLALTRWSNPEDPSPSSGAFGRRGHLMRAFACLALVRTPDGGPTNSLVPLIASALELGQPVVDDALRYLAWCRLHEPGDWRHGPADRPFLTFGLLLLAAEARRSDDLLGGLASVLLEEAENAMVEEGIEWQVHAAAPLLGLRSKGAERRLWKDLAGRCLIGEHGDSDLRRRLAQLGEAIRGQTDASTADLRPLFAEWDG